MLRLSRKVRDRSSIILAGEDGSRLSSFDENRGNQPVPRQFCLVFGQESALDRTLRRVSTATPNNLTLTVVTRAHRKFYENRVANNHTAKLLIQPQNRGTAAAILYALLRLEKAGRRGAVAIFPGDNCACDYRMFMNHVDHAFDALQSFPELVIVLGIRPDGPKGEFGWIEPGTLIGGTWATRHHLLRIRQFWEKPPIAVARDLFRRECLLNSNVVIANVRTLLDLYANALPHLYNSFGAFRPTFGTQFEEKAMELLYQMIMPSVFSETILVSCFSRLAVLPVSDVSWRNAVSPSRLEAVPMQL